MNASTTPVSQKQHLKLNRTVAFNVKWRKNTTEPENIKSLFSQWIVTENYTKNLLHVQVTSTQKFVKTRINIWQLLIRMFSMHKKYFSKSTIPYFMGDSLY